MTSAATRSAQTGDVETKAAPMTSMDRATAQQWRELGAAQEATSTAERVILALRLLDQVYIGFAVSQLTHCLQVASRAERGGADTEMVVAALCHDIGKVIPGGDHALFGAQLLRAYVRDEVYQVIRYHWFYGLRYTYQYVPGRRPDTRRRFRRKPWHRLAEQFSDEWDQASFDPAYETFPLEHFEERIREVFGRRRVASGPPGLKSRIRRHGGRLRIILGV
jgi:predicted HD phosphohydrolase